MSTGPAHGGGWLRRDRAVQDPVGVHPDQHGDREIGQHVRQSRTVVAGVDDQQMSGSPGRQCLAATSRSTTLPAYSGTGTVIRPHSRRDRFEHEYWVPVTNATAPTHVGSWPRHVSGAEKRPGGG